MLESSKQPSKIVQSIWDIILPFVSALLMGISGMIKMNSGFFPEKTGWLIIVVLIALDLAIVFFMLVWKCDAKKRAIVRGVVFVITMVGIVAVLFNGIFFDDMYEFLSKIGIVDSSLKRPVRGNLGFTGPYMFLSGFWGFKIVIKREKAKEHLEAVQMAGDSIDQQQAD